MRAISVSEEKPRLQFYVYCKTCFDVQPGKLRVCCADCKQGTLVLRKVWHQYMYSKNCFVRPLFFSTENGHTKQVTLQKSDKINIKSQELLPTNEATPSSSNNSLLKLYFVLSGSNTMA